MTIEDILLQEFKELRRDIIDNHTDAGQVASGRTRDSLSIDNVTDRGGQLSGASYIGVLETGRKGGKVPYDFIDILKRWAQAKGLTFSNEKDFNRWAWFVSQKIKREGTALYNRSGKEDIFTTAIKDFESRLANQTVVFYQQKITNEIFNF